MSEHQPFVHLHVHSEYSLLDGLSRIDDLVARARSLNQPALALTDHGAMYGVMPFYRACKAGGVKPIIGIESYVASRTMQDRDPSLDKERFHLLLLAKNQTGYQNLLKIASAAQLEGYYYRPRVDHDFLAAHAEGLIATTGCLAAEIPRAIDRGQMDKAHHLMGYYLEVFGPDNFYVELQEHDIPELVNVNNTLLEFAKRYNLRFLATNDVHYTSPEEAVPHDVLLCIQTSATVQQQNRMRLSNKEYYLKSHAEMAKLFGHIPGALENSLLIAEQCEVNLDMQGYHLPIFDVPEGYTPATYLRHLCQKGLAWRYGEARAQSDEALHARLEHELNIIGKMGFETYFLIVWDLSEFARRSLDWWIANGEQFYPGQSYEEWKEHDIWWNVRGSGAGSVVAYTLGITGIDPLANGLIFERFLNPGRVSMPDIDLDYPDDRRHEMVEYAMRKYGSDKVAQIITFGTLGARAAIRDVGRAMDVPLSQVDEIAKMIPAIPGKPVSIANVLDKDHEFYNAEFEALYKTDEAIRNLIETAQNLEGVSRHASSHAAGVIISDKPLVEYVPLNRPTSGEAGLGGIDRVTQWPMEVVESIGLLKVDFLGLSTLTVLRTAARLIEQRHGTKYQMDNIPYDVGHVGPDPSKKPEALFDMLGRGDVLGVFQVEGAGMRRLMMEMRPRRFDHIIAAISLYRPGPMENIPEYIRRMHADMFDGKDIVEYHTPALKPILGDTYGILVYQEQIIRIASDLAGYEPGEADMIRKAVSKKKRDLIDKHKIQFTKGAMARGFSQEVCDAIWGDIEFFARYGFNKSHAADYAVITCQTAFLKAHYPVEYMAALLSVDRDKTEKVAKYLAESRRLGIQVAPPDVNAANLDFTIEDTDKGAIIRYGMGAIKNAGEAAINVILDERREKGPFPDLNEFCDRVDLRRVGKRALESMIKVGVFDKWGTRPQLLDALDRMMANSGKTHDAAAVGQMSLFGMLGGGASSGIKTDLLRSDREIEVIDHRQLLDWEKELIGVYLSEHPLQQSLAELKAVVSATTSELDETKNGKEVVMAGLIAHLRPHTTKKGDAMAFGSLEDLEGKVDLLFFPRTWQAVRGRIKVDQIVIVRGKTQAENDSLTVIVDEVRDKFESVKPVEDADWNPYASGWQDEVIDMENGDDDWEPNGDGAVVAVRPQVGNGNGRKNGHAQTNGNDKGKPNGKPVPPRIAEPTAPRYTPPPPPPNFEESEPLAVSREPVAVSSEQSAMSSQQELVETQRNSEELSSRQPAVADEPSQFTIHNSQFTIDQPPVSQSPDASPDVPRTTHHAPRHVVIEIAAAANWRDTIRQVHRIASQHNGADSFTLAIPEKGLRMTFTEQPTRYGPELLTALRQVSGVRNIVAE